MHVSSGLGDMMQDQIVSIRAGLMTEVGRREYVTMPVARWIGLQIQQDWDMFSRDGDIKSAPVELQRTVHRCRTILQPIHGRESSLGE